MRRPNRTTDRTEVQPEPTGITLILTKLEQGFLKRQKGRTLGGFQLCENMLLDLLNPLTGEIVLDPMQHGRVKYYCLTGDKNGGAPNSDIRNSCIPAFRRKGIELLPDFSAAYVRKVPHEQVSFPQKFKDE